MARQPWRCWSMVWRLFERRTATGERRAHSLRKKTHTILDPGIHPSVTRETYSLRSWWVKRRHWGCRRQRMVWFSVAIDSMPGRSNPVIEASWGRQRRDWEGRRPGVDSRTSIETLLPWNPQCQSLTHPACSHNLCVLCPPAQTWVCEGPLCRRSREQGWSVERSPYELSPYGPTVYDLLPYKLASHDLSCYEATPYDLSPYALRLGQQSEWLDRLIHNSEYHHPSTNHDPQVTINKTLKFITSS